MFQVIDALGYIHTAYGTFVDDEGDIQFIFARPDGVFYKTNMINGYYKLYERFVIEVPNEEDK